MSNINLIASIDLVTFVIKTDNGTSSHEYTQPKTHHMILIAIIVTKPVKLEGVLRSTHQNLWQ